MLSDCPQCGQKLRPQWVRCPRCRVLLPEVATAPHATATGESTSDRRWRLGWVVVPVTAVVVVAAGWPTRDEKAAVPTRPAAVTAAANTAPDESSADAEAPASSVPTRAFKAIDSTRAAGVAYQEGDFATALAQLELAVAESPNDPEVRNNLGQLLVRQGRTADALPHFDAAVRLDGARWNYRFNRARAYGLLNRWPEAVAEYRVAAQAFPGDHATLYNLGLALLRVRDYAAAASSLEQAVAAAPEQHDFLITLGTAYVGADQTERARATFQRFLEVAPDDPEAPKVRALLQALADAAP